MSVDEIYRLDGTVEAIEKTVDTKQEDPLFLLAKEEPESKVPTAGEYFKRKLNKGEHLKWTKEIFAGIIENLSNCDDKNRNKLIKTFSQMVMKLSVEVLDLKNEAYKEKQKITKKTFPAQSLLKIEPAFVVSVPVQKQGQSTSSKKAPILTVKKFEPRQQVSISKINK